MSSHKKAGAGRSTCSARGQRSARSAGAGIFPLDDGTATGMQIGAARRWRDVGCLTAAAAGTLVILPIIDKYSLSMD